MRRAQKSIKLVSEQMFPAYMAGYYEHMRDAAIARARNTSIANVKQLQVKHARWAHWQYMRQLSAIAPHLRVVA